MIKDDALNVEGQRKRESIYFFTISQFETETRRVAEAAEGMMENHFRLNKISEFSCHLT